MKNLAVTLALLAIACGSGIALEIIKGPYLQNVTQTGITVMWETDKPSTSLVRYGDMGLSGYKGDERKVKIHEIRIGGLKPETRYRYKVISRSGGEGIQSEIYTFRTAPRRDTSFRFVVWGDNRTDVKMCKRVAELIASQNPDIVINVGDVVSNGNVYEQWGREYFGPMSCFAHSVPTYVAIGNHERNAHWFDDFVSQPGNEHWFAFSYGNSRFIILDTNRPYDPNSDQYKWLLKELRSKEFRKAAFRFVFFHHPPYSEQWDSPGYTGEEPVRRYLVPILERYGVDIVFSGHTHDYERGRKLLKDDREIFYIITGGGGSALDKVENKDWDVIQLHKSVYHCVVVDVKGGVLSFKAIGLNGDVVDSFRKVSLDEMARLAGAEKPFLKKQIQAVKDEDLMEDKFTFAVAGDTRSWLTIYQPETWYRIIKELNGIRPDFVMDVGDIISHGYTNDPELLMKEWREYFKAVSTSDIPVLPVAGNHDIWSEMSQMFWRRMIGDLWYSFDYGNSHFIILCSDQARPNYISRISPQQLEWLEKDLELHADAQHVFVFLHKPLWRDKKWDKVHELLKLYNTEAVIAGHVHLYERYEDRDGIKYIISGGGGAEMGDFRETGNILHYMLITVDGDKVYYSVVEPGSIHDMNVVTTSSASIASRISRAVSLSGNVSGSDSELKLSISNPFDKRVEVAALWDLPSGFRIYPPAVRLSIEPGDKIQADFHLHLDDIQTTLGQIPRLTVIYPTDEREVRLYRYPNLTGNYNPKIVLASHFDGRRREGLPHIVLIGKDPTDFSLRMGFAWDKDVLYLSGGIRDDKPSEGDSLSVGLLVGGNRIGFDIDKGKATLSINDRKLPEPGVLMFSRRGGNTSFSVFVPWKALKSSPKPGDLIRAKLTAEDVDDGAAEKIGWDGEILVAPPMFRGVR